jgi:hypothetical protein
MHNKVGITDAFWTYPGGSTIGVEIPGFGVFTDPQYFIGNDFTDPIGIRGLQFLVNVPEIPLDSLIPGETPGFGLAVPDFILDPISSTAFSLPSVTPGNFLYAQGETFDVVTGQVTGSFIQGHQAPVPEPPTLSLLGISTLALAGYRWYRGRRFTIGSPPKGQTHLKLKTTMSTWGVQVMRFARLWVSEVASQSPEGSLNLQETDRVSPVFRLSVRGGLGKARIPVGKMNASGCGFYDRKAGARTPGGRCCPPASGSC